MENPVIIFGASGLGTTVLEIFQSNNNIVYGFLDDDTALHGKEINFISILGSTEESSFLKLIGKKCDSFIAIENAKQRQFIVDMLTEERKVMPVNAVHARAYISSFAELGHGNMVGALSSIGANVKIGSHCIINTNVTIDYETEIEDFVQIGAGVVIANNVKIGAGAFIGAGATLIAGIEIGKSARIGAGSVVMNSIKARQTVFGIPAVNIKN